MRRVMALLFLPACLSVADHRAEVDLEVGRAGNDRVTVEVEDGLATVRALDGEDIHLWANAPTFTVAIGSTSGGPVTLRIENILPDASIEGATRIDGPVATEATWTLDPPSGVTTRYTISTVDRDDRSPWRIIVFADVQEAIDDVQDLYTLMNEVEGARFALIAGDLTEQGAVEQLERFQSELKSLGIPAYATLGNHELGNAEDNFHRYFGRGTSSFTFRGSRFTFMDSASAAIAPAADEMLDAWLDRPEDRLHVVTMHVPPIDPAGVRNGSFASRAEASRLLGRLASGGVDVTYYGHVHSFYAYDNAGIPAFITGGGGAIPERLDGVGRHFLTVDIDPLRERADTAIVRVD